MRQRKGDKVKSMKFANNLECAEGTDDIQPAPDPPGIQSTAKTLFIHVSSFTLNHEPGYK